MLEAGDKQGDIAQPDYLLWDFREVVQDCGLLDLSFSSHQYTWTRKEDGLVVMEEKLNRAMVIAS